MTYDAAVIVLHEQVGDSLILTKRSSGLRSHPGEICFPGGRWDEKDKTLYDTALRELHEELGISLERIQLQKKLQTQRTLSGYIIHPWLAYINTIEPYTINRAEVAALLRLPMPEVRNLANYKQMIIERRGLKIKTYEFVNNEHMVWGATAQIMMQLGRNQKDMAI